MNDYLREGNVPRRCNDREVNETSMTSIRKGVCGIEWISMTGEQYRRVILSIEFP